LGEVTIGGRQLKIIGVGHNRRIQKNSAILHAGMDAIENAGRLSSLIYKQSTLYTTLSPCLMCSGTVLLYQIPRIVIDENIKQNPLVIVESLCDYGCIAPLGTWGGNNYKQLLQIAKQESRKIQENNSYYEEKMNSPVNRIGTTAKEFQHGDFDSAVIRGLHKGDKNC